MKAEKQRVVIAEALGWRWTRTEASPLGIPPKYAKHSNAAMYEQVLPEYHSDLNAMHETEKLLTPTQAEAYLGWLWQICKVPFEANNYGLYFPLAHATAAQRAEAFIRTIGKWEEE